MTVVYFCRRRLTCRHNFFSLFLIIDYEKNQRNAVSRRRNASWVGLYQNTLLMTATWLVFLCGWHRHRRRHSLWHGTICIYCFVNHITNPLTTVETIVSFYFFFLTRFVHFTLYVPSVHWFIQDK